MKAFKVYWLESIAPKGEKYLGEAIVIAESIEEALAIGETYGPVKSVFTESVTVITAPKTALIEAELSRVSA